MSIIALTSMEYGTLAVRRADLENPFNDPTPEHFGQGFAWRDGSACFYLPTPVEFCRLEVMVEAEMASLTGEPQRIIKVPFTSTGSEIVIGEVLGADIIINLPISKYQIVFELVPGIGFDIDEGYPYDYFIRVRFSRDDNPQFEVLKQDEQMNFTGCLVTDAKPA